MLVRDPEIRDVPVKSLVLDPLVQIRKETRWQTVQEYADAMEDGAVFPPIVVFYKEGSKYYVGDGFHRTQAAKKIHLGKLSCEIHHGGKREAMLHAAGANAYHGLRRTNEDKRRAVVAILNDKKWRRWNDAMIARTCNVSDHLVARVRETLGHERDFRMQFNGRGELQYRKAGNAPRTSTSSQSKDPSTQSVATRHCPTCGQPIP